MPRDAINDDFFNKTAFYLYPRFDSGIGPRHCKEDWQNSDTNKAAKIPIIEWAANETAKGLKYI